MLPRDSVLGIAATGSAHLVEGGDAITGLEFIHAFSDAVDSAGDIVATIDLQVRPFWCFPGRN